MKLNQQPKLYAHYFGCLFTRRDFLVKRRFSILSPGCSSLLPVSKMVKFGCGGTYDFGSTNPSWYFLAKRRLSGLSQCCCSFSPYPYPYPSVDQLFRCARCRRPPSFLWKYGRVRTLYVGRPSSNLDPPSLFKLSWNHLKDTKKPYEEKLEKTPQEKLEKNPEDRLEDRPEDVIPHEEISHYDDFSAVNYQYINDSIHEDGADSNNTDQNLGQFQDFDFDFFGSYDSDSAIKPTRVLFQHPPNPSFLIVHTFPFLLTEVVSKS